jgi:Lysozyme like domain
VATLTPGQIYGLAMNAGFSASDAAVATAIALAESGGRTDAEGDLALQNGTWGPSVGLWQIRSVKADTGTGKPRDYTRLKDPAFNAAAAYAISNGGKNFKPWSTYTSGKYKDKLSQLTAGDVGTGILDSIPGGGLVSSVLGPEIDAASAVSSGLTGWAADAMKIGLYVLAGGACVALVVVGAVHTVSNK